MPLFFLSSNVVSRSPIVLHHMAHVAALAADIRLGHVQAMSVDLLPAQGGQR
jgi:hypothetical protein